MTAFSLIDLPTMSFAPSRVAAERAELLSKHVGLREKYQCARLAIARSLALSQAPELLPSGTERATAIRGQNLFGGGTDAAGWIALVVEAASLSDPTREDVNNHVVAHWHRGVELLWEEWKSAGNSYDAFLLRLAAQAGLGQKSGVKTTATGHPVTPEELGAVVVRLGEIGVDERTQEPVTWPLNGPGHSPHFAILGEVGTGKTRTLCAILRQMQEKAKVPAVIFDLKGDLRDNKELIKLFDAEVVDIPRTPVPLDVFSVADRSAVSLQLAADQFAETFERAKRGGIGDVQLDAVKEATRRALADRMPVTLPDVRDKLLEVYEERDRAEDGAVAFLNSLCSYELFRPQQEPANFFKRSCILTFSQATDEMKRLVSYLVLDSLDRYLNGSVDAPQDEHGNRNIRCLCVVDEARELLGVKQPALVRLVRMSRSKGGVVILASQSPDDFSSEDDDFLANVGLTIAFRTNARPAALNRIFGSRVDLPSLKDGYCITRLADGSGARRTVRVKAWAPPTKGRSGRGQ